MFTTEITLRIDPDTKLSDATTPEAINLIKKVFPRCSGDLQIRHLKLAEEAASYESIENAPPEAIRAIYGLLAPLYTRWAICHSNPAKGVYDKAHDLPWAWEGEAAIVRDITGYTGKYQEGSAWYRDNIMKPLNRYQAKLIKLYYGFSHGYGHDGYPLTAAEISKMYSFDTQTLSAEVIQGHIEHCKKIMRDHVASTELKWLKICHFDRDVFKAIKDGIKQAKTEAAKSERASADKEIERLRASANEEIERLRTSANEEIDRLKKELSKQQSKVATANRSIARLKGQNDRLAKQLAEKQAELQPLKELEDYILYGKLESAT